MESVFKCQNLIRFLILFFFLGMKKLPSRKKRESTSQRNEKARAIRRKIKEKLIFPRKEKTVDSMESYLKIESSSLSTSPTKFNSLPEYPSSIHTHWKDPKDLVEEEGLEV